MAASWFAIFCMKFDEPQKWFDGIPQPAEPAPLMGYTRTWKRHFRSVFGNEFKNLPVDYRLDADGHAFRVVEALALHIPPSIHDDVFRYNGVIVLRIAALDEALAPSDEEGQEITRHIYQRFMTGRIGDDGPEDYTPESVIKAMPLDFLRHALERQTDFSIEMRHIDDRTGQPTGTAFSYAYYITAGYGMVHVEHRQIDLVHSRDSMSSSDVAAETARIRKRLSFLRCVFFTRSQSYLLLRRAQCEEIMEQFRLRDRFRWHAELNSDFESIALAESSARRERLARRTNRVIFLLTAFTVISGTFFGFFSLAEDADILKRGIAALADIRLVPVLFLALAILVVTLATERLAELITRR